MPSGSRDFAAEIAALEALVASNQERAVTGLRAVTESWARALLGVREGRELVECVREAVERGIAPDVAERAGGLLADAQRWQWQIGTWATGAGEGLASMFEVRTLQLAQAWLLAAQRRVDDATANRALELLRAVTEDPNRVAARLDEHAAALRERIG